MPEQSGLAAVQAKQAALAARDSRAADADHVLAAVLQGAHAATVTARRRLDAIAAEIDGCVADQATFAVDTPLGAHELQRLLLAKHRQLLAIVEEAHRDDAAKQAVLESLLARYSSSASD